MRRAPSPCAAAVALVLASAPLLPAQSPLPEPGTEEYAATRAEAVVQYLADEGNDADLQYSSSPFLVSYLEEHGLDGLTSPSREVLRSVVVDSLEALRESGAEPARVRAGVAVRLVPWFGEDEDVRLLLHEILELHFDRVAWRPEFFAALRRLRLVETLPHFRSVVDRFAELPPDALATAPYPYPLREAFACLAAIGGDAEAKHLAAYLRPGVPPALRGPALTALGEMEGETSRAMLVAFADDASGLASATPAERYACGAALCARDDPRGARILLDLVVATGDPRAFTALRCAAGRPLASADDAKAWVDGLGGESLRAARRAAIEEGGYAIGDLDSPDEVEALLSAATDGEEYRRRAAWAEVVDLLGEDPSHGRFWTFRAVRRDIEVEVEKAPGERLESSAEEHALEEVQAEMVGRARRTAEERGLLD